MSKKKPFGVPLSEEEREKLRKMASDAGLTSSDYVRQVVLYGGVKGEKKLHGIDKLISDVQERVARLEETVGNLQIRTGG